MDLLQDLADEHRVISRTLDALEGFVARVRASGEYDPQDFPRFVCFFREFAELVHHDKEEHLLFPAMGLKGYARGGAPIAYICEQHREERNIIQALQQLAVLRDPLGMAHCDQVVHLATQLIDFERAHMKKENELLYPTVRAEFGEMQALALAEKLTIGGQAERWVGDTSWLRDLADELHERYATI
jgi:hemerythrin-like domain-containing protein